MSQYLVIAHLLSPNNFVVEPKAKVEATDSTVALGKFLDWLGPDYGHPNHTLDSYTVIDLGGLEQL